VVVDCIVIPVNETDGIIIVVILYTGRNGEDLDPLVKTLVGHHGFGTAILFSLI